MRKNNTKEICYITQDEVSIAGVTLTSKTKIFTIDNALLKAFMD